MRAAVRQLAMQTRPALLHRRHPRRRNPLRTGPPPRSRHRRLIAPPAVSVSVSVSPRHSASRLHAAALLLLAPLFVGCSAPALARKPHVTISIAPTDLVDITSIPTTADGARIHLDLRYATSNNFTGRAVY